MRVIDEIPGLLKDPACSETRHEDTTPLARRVRQQIAVSHLHLERSTTASSKPVICEDPCAVNLKIMGWLVVSETSGIVVALVVVLIWRSTFML